MCVALSDVKKSPHTETQHLMYFMFVHSIPYVTLLSDCLFSLIENVNLLGGWHDKSPDAQDVQAAASYAVEKFNSRSKAKKNFKLISITSAKAQVRYTVIASMVGLWGKSQ